jgi:predicted metal-dependent phosphoesterase TrpH
MTVSFDLQSHSTASDGALSPTDVVAAAHAAGIRLLALSDHDSVSGVPEALAAARRLPDLTLVPALEVSALDEAGTDQHVCGYLVDHNSPDLLAALADWRRDRVGRASRMIDALRECGWSVDADALQAMKAQDRSIGRPHLAAAVFQHPDNAARIAEEGLRTATDVLVAYLTPGGAAFLTRTTPTMAEAIEVIHRAGGLAIWAHPFWDVEAPEHVVGMIDRFRTMGLDGVEAYYATFTEAQTRLLHETAVQRDLLTTGSADFHGPSHPNFHRFGAFSTYGLEPRLGPIGDLLP